MFKTSFILILLLSLLLLGCDFRPSHKVIKYQEEVKLSDGSFIWVDIKRHYRLVGEPFQKKGYLPSIVEVSWDTGFEGVGRQSVFFDESIDFIDKIDEVWYVVGYRYPYEGNLQGVEAVNCWDVGYLINRDYDCILAINRQGFVKNYLPNDVLKSDIFRRNLVWTTGFDDWRSNIYPYLINDTLSWDTKLNLKNRQSVLKPYHPNLIN